MKFPSLPFEIGRNSLLVIVAAYLAAFCNFSFFSNVLKAYPPGQADVGALISLAILFVAVNALLLSLSCFGRLYRPILIVLLVVSSVVAYFADVYGVVVSDEMIRNALQTNAQEAADLMTGKLALYTVLMGLLPAWLVAGVRLRQISLWKEVRERLLFVLGALLVVIACVVPFSGYYASFGREHKALRAYAIPGYPLYSLGKLFFAVEAASGNENVRLVGEDAHIPETDTDRELIILVVGETARADRFSINGYGRETTPELTANHAVSFTNFWSCGTSTAVSVPCMFSTLGEKKFDLHRAAAQENLLDILRHADVNVLWLDNNSDSKGVAIRTSYQSYRSAKLNPACDPECRDVGMLANLQRYIDSKPKGDIFIVLHQMGNHGPAYSKRYPKSFERFKPVCEDVELGNCSKQEIDNSYDNAVLYTDHFLGKTIELLKHNDEKFETALFYVSDHGESLGENGIYLHGLPGAIAPEAQTHIPALLWFGKGFHEIDRGALRKMSGTRLTHDSVVHTVLGLMEIQTRAYRPELDILNKVRSEAPMKHRAQQ